MLRFCQCQTNPPKLRRQETSSPKPKGFELYTADKQSQKVEYQELTRTKTSDKIRSNSTPKEFEKYESVLNKANLILPKYCIELPIGGMNFNTMMYKRDDKDEARNLNKHNKTKCHEQENGINPLVSGSLYAIANYQNKNLSYYKRQIRPSEHYIQESKDKFHTESTNLKRDINTNYSRRENYQMKSSISCLKVPKRFLEYYTTYMRSFQQWLDIIDRAYPTKTKDYNNKISNDTIRTSKDKNRKEFPDRIFLEKAVPIVPQGCISPPHGNMAFETTYKREFLDQEISEKAVPIIPPGGISPPHGNVISETTYNREFLVQGNLEKAVPIIPPGGISPPHGNVISETTYNREFLVQGNLDKAVPIIPPGAISPPHGNVISETTYNREFLVQGNLDKAVPIIPPSGISPPHGNVTSETTYNREFLDRDNLEKTVPIIPPAGISPPHGNVISETTYRSEFQCKYCLGIKAMPFLMLSPSPKNHDKISIQRTLITESDTHTQKKYKTISPAKLKSSLKYNENNLVFKNTFELKDQFCHNERILNSNVGPEVFPKKYWQNHVFENKALLRVAANPHKNKSNPIKKSCKKHNLQSYEVYGRALPIYPRHNITRLQGALINDTTYNKTFCNHHYFGNLK